MVKRSARGLCSCGSARESSATHDGEAPASRYTGFSSCFYTDCPQVYTRSSDANATDPFISARQQDNSRLGPHTAGAGCGRRADPRADAKPPVLRAFCLLEGLSHRLIADLRSYDASGLNSSSLSRQPFQPRSCLAAASAELKCSCVRMSSVPFSKSRNLRVTNVSLP
jgi:hypothetical protein